MLPPRFALPLVILPCLTLFFAAPAARADMTAACHCFRDRTFNPAAPFSSDDYLLTNNFGLQPADAGKLLTPFSP